MSPFLLLFFVTSSLAEHAVITPQNSSQTVIRCPIAESFIQTHMAPDFESPQLVRRLDWFHDEALVASYQSNVVADASRQWWVADSRFELQRPFYSLKLSPVLPGDAGIYRCRLETDPLFTLSLTTSHMELNVLVRPSPPSTPEITAITNRSVTLSWTHSPARAHRPIIRFSISVRLLADGSRFIIPAPSNGTSIQVDALSPFSLYSFAVRAENAAGLSDFGPEKTQRTLGEAPTYPPRITGVTNGSDGCVAVSVEEPFQMHGQIQNYFVSLAGEGLKPASERFGRGNGPLTICGLQPSRAYTISITAQTQFGTSPPAQHTFHTDLSVPQTAPTNVTVQAVVGTPKLLVRWKPPERSQDIIQYNVYHKAQGQNKWKVERLPITGKSLLKHEVIGLNPRTVYSIRLSAVSTKGEGPRSVEHIVATDVIIPPAVEIEKISYDCHEGVFIQWTPVPGRPEYKVEVGNLSNTLSYNTSQTSIQMNNLLLNQEYSVRVAAAQRSRVDDVTHLPGQWGMEQRFILSNGCKYQSSLCSSSGAKCQPLVAAVPVRSFPLFLFLVALSVFLILCLFVFFFLKGHCLDVKALLKKNKEKCVYLDEITPLVYDSAGFEDIPVELFYGYCLDLAKSNNAKYKLQFEQIEQMTNGITSETDSLDKNLDKNRYLNIGAIDSSRVRLHSSDQDYINASWIDSCDKKAMYIATQAPMPNTFADFWTMVWQERSNVIVVITNLIEDGRRKCDQYWPSSSSSPQAHGSYQVSLVSETNNAYFSHRVLNLKIVKCVPPTERRVHQLHFHGWPDHGVPDSVFPLLNFMHFVSDIHTTGPIVVHCSAGVGRSGSFILVDSMRRHLTNQRKLNLMGHLVHMRRQREKLVQTVEQYIFCHQAVSQLIRHGITRVHVDLFQRYIDYLGEENANGKSRIEMQYEELYKCKHVPQCSLPEEYIVLPGYHRIEEFVVASWPVENEQLWELIWKRNCQTVVLLGDNSYWIHLETVREMSIQYGEQFVVLQKGEDQLCVKIILLDPAVLETNFWKEVERLQKKIQAYHDGPLLILNPLQKLHTTSSLTRNGGVTTTLANGSPLSQTLSLPCLVQTTSPSLAYCMCALTALACQLESTGCIDVVSIISSYHCLWQLRDIEFIYDQLTILVGGSRV